ncbi:MAG TPA: 2-succinyl-5-enolpyruvyl-6-hydroxy-3-cyclohexene-1-carboxylic-acid synthase, partial [Polyangiaceae bacterium]|nr:2-succinyl-5-enolpyruvyl-6-hydroxy-3-cyclohexene-1-carboxylic-acid synthase [Polyangiaceae bacterium]
MSSEEASDVSLDRWARLLLGGLARAGLREVILSPGSRSTPFAWAALHTPELACHSVWDERAAGFFALGLARVSGRPALLLCTSGSAAANYFPAVVEASLSRVPLVILTADRPFELQAAAAAQTIDQIKLYGDFARQFFELGLPDSSPSALRGLLRIAQQAALVSLHPEPGPVQLNARAKKPLEPVRLPELRERLEAEVSGLLEQAPLPIATPEISPAPSALAELARACARARSGLIVCGPAPLGDSRSLHALAELSLHTGFPLLAEATSQLRFPPPGSPCERARNIDGFDFVLRSAELRHALLPEIVLCCGAPPTSTGLDLLLQEAPEYHVLAVHGFPDPRSRATSLSLGPPAAMAQALLGLIPEPPSALSEARRLYAERFARADAAGWKAVTTVLAGGEKLHEGAAVRAAIEALPRGSLLVLGNSLPVREVDQYVRAGSRALGVVSQRGANGIDGIVSGAAGAALAHAGPTLLLVGDVSFLHDLAGLDLCRRAERPLVLFVLDNAGGRIFEQLPMAEHFAAEPELSRYWLTPPDVDLEHAALLFGLPYARAETPAELTGALTGALERRGATLIHARIEPES